MGTIKSILVNESMRSASDTYATGECMLCNEYPQLYFDGCSKGNPGRAGAGVVIYKNKHDQTPLGELYTHVKFVGINETNNVAEYTGLIVGLQDAVKLNIKNIVINGDSLLVIKQMQGIYQVKSPSLKALYQEAKALEKQFDTISYNHVYRINNKRADALANDALANDALGIAH
jgi:ribonuclease HI